MKSLLALLALTAFLASCAKPGETKIVTVPGQVITPAQAPVTPKTQVDGTVNGGGGKGVVCKKNGKTTVEVLDLYEARKIYDLKMVNLGNNEDSALKKLATLMHTYTYGPWNIEGTEEYANTLTEIVRETFLKKLKFTEPNQSLKHIPDANEVLLEEGCEYVQIAVYYDESVIIVDKIWWDQLDWTNKLALISHEMAYHTVRSTGTKNSIGVRKFVGHLFSEPGLTPKFKDVPRDPSKRLECRVSNQLTSYAAFFVYNSPAEDSSAGQGHTIGVFSHLQGHEVLFRTTAKFHASDLAAWMGKSSAWGTDSDIKVDSYFSMSESKHKMSIRLQGEGKGIVHFINQADGTTSAPMELRCTTQSTFQPQNQSQPAAEPQNPAASTTSRNPPISPTN